MEWKDILSWIVPIGLMFMMMRFGGCCGGHSHSGSRHGSHNGGSCCGGANGKDVSAKNGGTANNSNETERKSCH